MTNYILQQDINWFGKTIKAGTRYAPHGNDYYWPIINDAHCPSQQVDFYTVKNNPKYFLPETVSVKNLQHHEYLKGNRNDSFWFQFQTDQNIHLERHRCAIEKAISFIISQP